MSIAIGEVSERSKLPASTLRYYEELGLIQPIGRHGLKRIYAADVIEKLAFISLGRVAGLTLEEIGMMMAAGKIEVDRALLRQKADQLDAKIKQLKSMRDGLRHAAECSAPSHMECPKFLRLLRIASQRWQRNKNAK